MVRWRDSETRRKRRYAGALLGLMMALGFFAAIKQICAYQSPSSVNICEPLCEKIFEDSPVAIFSTLTPTLSTFLSVPPARASSQGNCPYIRDQSASQHPARLLFHPAHARAHLFSLFSPIFLFFFFILLLFSSCLLSFFFSQADDIVDTFGANLVDRYSPSNVFKFISIFICYRQSVHRFDANAYKPSFFDLG